MSAYGGPSINMVSLARSICGMDKDEPGPSLAERMDQIHHRSLAAQRSYGVAACAVRTATNDADSDRALRDAQVRLRRLATEWDDLLRRVMEMEEEA